MDYGLDIVKYAEILRPGHHIVAFENVNVESLAAGSCDVHCPIRFEDGPVWMARINRLGFSAPPRPIRRIIMQGEIGVLRWLKEVVQVTVPEVMSGILGKYFFRGIAKVSAKYRRSR